MKELTNAEATQELTHFVNILFKLAIVVLAIWFVWVYSEDTANSRYKPFPGNPAAHIVLEWTNWHGISA